MDFSDTPDEAGFRNERAFLERHAEPRRGTFETWQSRYPDREGLERAKDFQRKRAEAGLAGLHWPKAYGGREAPAIFQVILAQEETRYLIPRGYFEIGLGMCMPTLFSYATEEQQRRYAPAARRHEVWCQLSEPGAGSDLAGLRTRAVRDGATGSSTARIWTSGAHWADRHPGHAQHPRPPAPRGLLRSSSSR
jgi:acyl-CoA dehydrogenase